MSLPYLQPYLGLSNGLNTLHAAGGAGGIGGWVELGRTTLGSPSDTITVSSLADKRYYMILGHTVNTGGDTVTHVRANGDTGANYAQRRSKNGLTDLLANPTTVFCTSHNSKTIDSRFIQGYIANYSTKEKLGIFQTNENPATGAGTAPSRIEGVGKHAQTSNPINELQLYNDEAGSFDTGGELVVLGYDPADTHTNNFWEELASVEADGTSTDMSSGTISARKYLWIQLYQKGIAGDVRLRFNSDSGSNYTRRYSQNGAADGTDTSAQHISNMIGFGTTPSFGNAFIINNASSEKLVVGHHISQNTAGATTAPQRMEFACKWANTSNQITNVNILSSSGNFPSGSIFKVWGAD
jgi:hypothetical protein